MAAEHKDSLMINYVLTFNSILLRIVRCVMCVCTIYINCLIFYYYIVLRLLKFWSNFGHAVANCFYNWLTDNGVMSTEGRKNLYSNWQYSLRILRTKCSEILISDIKASKAKQMAHEYVRVESATHYMRYNLWTPLVFWLEMFLVW